MPDLRALVAVLLLAMVAWSAALRAKVFEGYPDVIVCRLPPSTARPQPVEVVLYVDARVENGPVIYKPLGQSAVTVEIGADGVVRAGRVRDCDGLTLQELREQGRAFDFR